MRRILTIVLAGLLGFVTPAFAQNAPPVLIGQSSGQPSDPPSGQDAYAQAQDQTGGLSPLLIAGGIGLGIVLAIWAGTQKSTTRTPLSP